MFGKILFPVTAVMGDCKGNDTIAGKYGSHSAVSMVPRACNCPTAKVDDINFKYQFHTKEQVLVNDGCPLALKIVSQHRINNTFHKICFGGDPYSIHGCTPVDAVCHASQLGTYQYILTIFFCCYAQCICHIQCTGYKILQSF